MCILVRRTFQRKKVLTEIEKGEYKDERVFTDRFGNHLYYTEMSAGSKALFELEGLPDKVINGAEMGFNALRLVAEIPECSIYFAQRREALPFRRAKTELYLNGKHYEDCELLNQKIMSGGIYMEIIVGNMVVSIELPPGIYATEDDSAVGKTYLARLLQASITAGDMNCLVVTYFAGITTDLVVKRLREKSYSFVMLDRLDLYLSDDIADALVDLREDTCIFVDLKNWSMTKAFCPDLVDFEFTERGIRLYEGDVVLTNNEQGILCSE